MNRALRCPATPEEHAAAPLAGGILRNGHQCGMVWGSALAAGAEAYRCLGAGPRAEGAALAAARRIVETFRAQNGAVDCFDLTGTDFRSTAQTLTYLVSGRSVGCFRMAARYAPVALAEIRAELAGEHAEAPAAPVSCSAMVARRLGATDLHEVMVAGFAGGVGLSGGGCGALAAAVWLDAMAGGGGREVEARATRIVDRFLRASGHAVECSAIVGRRFADVPDHAAHLRGGGCERILDALCAG